MSQTYSRESDLAADVARILRCPTWAEVELPGVREIPDLVAAHPDFGLTVIETKLGVSFDAVAQAAAWTDHANSVFLAVPYRRDLFGDGREADLIRLVCKSERIGLWCIGSVSVVAVWPIRNPNPRNIGFKDVLEKLPEYDPETATRHPGTPGRAERPELRDGRAMLMALVYARPGARINRYREVLADKMGQRTAQRVIADAKAGKVPGVMAVRSGGLWRLQPASEEKAA